MAKQLLIYETAVPVTAARHGNWSLDMTGHFEFSRNVTSLPLMAVEFPMGAQEYSIVFAAGADESVMPLVILGLRNEENLFLNAEGAWGAKYLPAFLRRYPFVFASLDEGNSFTLCIDETYPGFNQEGRGQRLFENEDKPTAFVQEVLKFLQEFQMQSRVTEAFCKKLKELNLLESMQADVTLNSGERLSLGGFQVVNRDRLKNLPEEKLAELAKSDELELIYLHLHSMRNLNAMINRLVPSGPAA